MASDVKTRIAALQARPESIRNICILAHVDHGKTTLSDSLLSSNGIISSKLSGKVRYLDSLPEEQERGITMKSSGISLFFNLVQQVRLPDSNEIVKKSSEFLINLIDSPGHVDFSTEVSTASRLCDGGLVLVDVVEGVCTQTHTVLRQAWVEQVRPILVLNKIDRLITELKLTPLEAYLQLNNIIEQVNAIIGTFYAEGLMEDATKRYEAEIAAGEDLNVDVGASAQASAAAAGQDTAADEQALLDDSDLYFAPERGNVIFASAIDGWAFRVSQFSQLYAAKLGIKESLLSKVLWGDYYLDTKAKKVVGRKGLRGRPLKPMFVQFVLDNIWSVYNAILVEPDRDKVEKIVKTLGVKILPRDLKSKDVKALVQNVMTQWLPLSRAVLLSVIQHVPSPLVAQAKRMPQILHPELPSLRNTTTAAAGSFAAEPVVVSGQSPDRDAVDHAIYACSADASAPVVAFVSKMFSITRDLLPNLAKNSTFTPEEMRQRRQEIIQKSKALERDKVTAGISDGTTDNGVTIIAAPPKQAASADDSNDEVLIGFARIYSGCIHVGQTIRVLDPKYDPLASDADQHVSEATVERLFLMMGRELQDLDCVPAGNVFGIMGLQKQVLKTATISSSLACPSLAGVKLDAPPIVRVAVEPQDPTQMNQLVEGLKMLNRADPCVEVHFEDSGENVIVCAGELHLERCLKDLRERFARISVQASLPIVPFRETLSIFPAIQQQNDGQDATAAAEPSASTSAAAVATGTVTLTTRNKLCTIRLRALPLPPRLRTLLDDASTVERLRQIDTAKDVAVRTEWTTALVADMKEAVREAIKDDEPVVSKVDWDSILDRLVTLGPKGVGSNLLSCTASNYEMSRWVQSAGKKERRRQATDESTDESAQSSTMRMGDYETSIVSAFQMGTASGPLCAEPMSGVCFVIESVDMSPPSVDDEDGASKLVALPGQILTTMRDGIRQSFLSWSPRLMLAMYSCDLQTPTDILGKVYAVLNRRRGRILSEDMKEGTPFFQIKAVMPVIESFGFADELRKRSSGAASPQLLFTGFEVMDLDPFWVPTTEEELEDLGEKADRENLAKKYMEGVRKRKGLAIEKKVVEHAEKQKTLKNK